jgi:2-iminobutanoate/2-iminopropanoate deaminase
MVCFFREGCTMTDDNRRRAMLDQGRSKRESVFTEAAPRPFGHYSQAVRAGGFVFVSGQLPVEPSGKMVEGNFTKEVIQTLENVRAIVEAAGGQLSDIVQCTLYVSDSSLWSEANQAYSRFFESVQILPARAVVPVKTMHYGARIEIQAIALIG